MNLYDSYDPFNFMIIIIFIYIMLLGFIYILIYNNTRGNSELARALQYTKQGVPSTTCVNCIPSPTSIIDQYV
jgi:hypothetical protein